MIFMSSFKEFFDRDGKVVARFYDLVRVCGWRIFAWSGGWMDTGFLIS
jgi:hypothetical protein